MRCGWVISLAFVILWPVFAFGQATVLQGGPPAPGHAPQYFDSGAQPVIGDSGPAGGGALGLGLSEINVTARGNGNGPFPNSGTGPLGEHGCFFDTYATSPAGYHYLCFDANVQGGGLIDYGAANGAAQLPLQFMVNGVLLSPLGQLLIGPGKIAGNYSATNPAQITGVNWMASGAACPTWLSNYQMFANTSGSPSATALAVYNPTTASCDTWATLNETTGIWTFNGSQAQPTLQSYQVLGNNGATAAPATGIPARILLTQDTTWYVNPNTGGSATCGTTGALTCSAGSDSVTAAQAESPSTPFATLQNAIAVISKTYDYGGVTPTINLAHGVDPGHIQCASQGANIGRNGIQVTGDTNAPNAAQIQAPNGSYALQVRDHCGLVLNSLGFVDQGSGAFGIVVGQQAVVDLNIVTFNAFNASSTDILLFQDGSMNVNTTCGATIAGGGGTFLQMQDNSTFSPKAGIPAVASTICIPVAKAFTTIANLSGSAAITTASSTLFTGSGVAGTTGIRAALSGSAYVNTSGAGINSLFPGNANATLTGWSSTDVATDTLTTPCPVASGCTGIASFNSNTIYKGNGTSALQGTSIFEVGGAVTVNSESFGLTGNITASGIFGTNGIRYKNTPATLSDSSSSGTIAANYDNAFGGSTLTASSATTLTNEFGSYFKAATCSTNVTCTNKYALGADSGYFGGQLTINQNAISLPASPFVTIPGTVQFGADSSNTGYSTYVFAGIGVNGFVRADGTAASPSALGSGEEIGRLTFGGAASSSSLQSNRAKINCWTAEAWSTTAYGTYCSIFTTVTGGGSPSTTEKFRFQNDGGFSVGNANIATDGGAGIVVATGATLTTLANAATTSAVCYNTSTGVLTYDGTIGTCNTSGRWAKNIIAEFSDADALRAVVNLDTRDDIWKYKQDEEYKGRFDKRLHVGLIADDVAKMDPRCVGYKDDGRVSDYDERCVIAYLVGAIKQQQAEIEYLKHRR